MLEVGSDSDADDASTVQLAYRDTGRDGMTSSGRQSRAKSATPRELADTLAKLLGGSSLLLALWLDIEEAAMLPDEASAIADPLARIINRQKWLKGYVKHLIGTEDYIALAVAVYAYGARIQPLIAAKAEAQNSVKRAKQAQAVRPPAQPERPADGGGNGHKPADSSGGVKFSGFAGFGADAS